ncbi:DUF3422 family protein [Rhodobacter calidifons]|uniref:DUF3422 domain-containing protein n=1 Tax=Rhodobacter calidifons TaxID=2715277 RepID=A0ABX0G869_9RHOB|nr:DUF3422 domain-containing protein [Rhodobacter calidifons]NHB77424.1 DUF3422 domain-containing protein [Rhodobacter calidifons]
MPIIDHPLRYATVNELHARPFPSLEVPSTAVYLAIKEPVQAHNRDRDRDRAHLLALLDRYGSAHPQPGATHFHGPIGRAELKWESHTEFVTYTAFTKGLSARPFDPAEAEVLPEDWLAAAPGKRLTSVLIRVEQMPSSQDELLRRLDEWFVPESLAVSQVVEGAAVVAGDFRIDPGGHMRFAVFVAPGMGPRRVGRIVQRLCEIETYRAMSMLGLMRSRDLSGRLNALDPKLSALVSGLENAEPAPEAALHDLLSIAAELESLAVQFSFRFGATAAYEAIVNQRIQVLREQQIEGRQTFAEFMMRRYEPAMRTVKSAENRLAAMAERAERAAELLRTRVDVERSAQNQKLLESMDQRADLQLRLQRTVEGLSTVAISYYAVNLAAYLLEPAAHALHISHGVLLAGLVPVVVLAVWLMVRRIRKTLH